MANINHSALTDPYLHEPIGASAAAKGKVYVSDGAGSGTWHFVDAGWGYYKDNATAQNFTSTPALLSIDGLGSTTVETFLPYAIRGSGSLWNTTTDKITPVQAGDAYSIRLDLPVTAEAASPTELTVELDIAGSTYGSAIVIVNHYEVTGKSTPYTISISFPVFVGSTFIANGGQFWLTTDTGNLDVTAPAITLAMLNNGANV